MNSKRFLQPFRSITSFFKNLFLKKIKFIACFIFNLKKITAPEFFRQICDTYVNITELNTLCKYSVSSFHWCLNFTIFTGELEANKIGQHNFLLILKVEFFIRMKETKTKHEAHFHHIIIVSWIF